MPKYIKVNGRDVLVTEEFRTAFLVFFRYRHGNIELKNVPQCTPIPGSWLKEAKNLAEEKKANAILLERGISFRFTKNGKEYQGIKKEATWYYPVPKEKKWVREKNIEIKTELLSC